MSPIHKDYPFVQEAKLFVEGGSGGRGAVHFRREKYVPKGGPDGGDGGDGGSVYLVLDRHKNTLYHLQRRKVVRAEDGSAGSGDKTGRDGKDVEIPVPPGTEVWDEDAGWKLGELLHEGDRLLVARGGRGGRGNRHFATPSHQTPEEYEEGEEGQKKKLRLELKLLADVGLVGLPNAGKSTLLSSLSRARPKIASYPFTTKVPHLGIVQVDEAFQFVMADIPGLIKGAHQGKGLGVHFLAQIARTRVLLHLVDLSQKDDPIEQVEVVRGEMEAYDGRLLQKPFLIVLTKADLTEVKKKLQRYQNKLSRVFAVPVLSISAVQRKGLKSLIQETVSLLKHQVKNAV